MFRRIVPGYRTRISFVPAKVTPRTYLSNTKIVHTAECLQPPAWRPRPHAGARAAAFERSVARQNGEVVLSDMQIGHQKPGHAEPTQAFRRDSDIVAKPEKINYEQEGKDAVEAHLHKAGSY